MRIISVETIRLGEFPNLLWLRLHTDEGVYGLGEAFRGAATVEAYVHELAAPYLLGRDPLHIERHWHELAGYVGRYGSGAETRGRSAVDLALWDLFGRVTGLPVYQLLGGPSRDSIRVYNTCAGTRYMRGASIGPSVENFGTGVAGAYEDLDAFLHRPAELAEHLLSEGITAMKIWPFDDAAAGGGHEIDAAGMRAGLEPFRRIREAVGDRIDIMAELHARWRLPAAKRVVRALEEYDPYWVEDPVPPDDAAALAGVAAATTIPIAASETLTGTAAFRRLIDAGALGVVMFDIGWCGGLTEARKITALAEAAHLPIAPHDCTGPVALATAAHLSIHAPNALVQEFVRAAYHGWYAAITTGLPPIRDGRLYAPTGPGLGIDLAPGVTDRDDAVVRRTTPATA